MIQDTNARNRMVAGIFLFLLVLLAVSPSGCRKSSPPAPAQPLQAAKPQPIPPARNDLQSCREFVQGFYDRYWNHMAAEAARPDFDPRKLPTVQQLLKQDPAVLSPELASLLTHEEQEMTRRHEVGSLDFDPFLNSQDPQGKYQVGSVTMEAGGCMAKIDKADMLAELKNSGASWVFTNFHYSYYGADRKTKIFPDNDLVHILETSPLRK